MSQGPQAKQVAVKNKIHTYCIINTCGKTDIQIERKCIILSATHKINKVTNFHRITVFKAARRARLQLISRVRKRDINPTLSRNLSVCAKASRA